MEQDRISLREAWVLQWRQLRSVPFKPVFIILSATVIQIVARFHTSRFAFRQMVGAHFAGDPNFELYEHCFWLLGDFVLQFPLLLLLIRVILKDSVSSYGLQAGNGRLGLKVSVIFWVCMLPILWFVSASGTFQQAHPAPALARTDWGWFAFYEVCSIIYIIGWEFIWRGYVLFGLKEYIGYYAVFIQMVPFALLHLGTPEIETFAAVVAGVGLGMFALATRSFWYGALLHILILGTMDILGALRFHAGNSGIGLSDLFEVISKNLAF